MIINLYESAIIKLYESGKTINDIENVSWVSSDLKFAYNIIDWNTFEEAAKRINYDSDCILQVIDPSLRINLKDGDFLYRTHIGDVECVECWGIAKRENSLIFKNTIDISDILNDDLNAYKQYCIFKDYEED